MIRRRVIVYGWLHIWWVNIDITWHPRPTRITVTVASSFSLPREAQFKININIRQLFLNFIKSIFSSMSRDVHRRLHRRCYCQLSSRHRTAVETMSNCRRHKLGLKITSGIDTIVRRLICVDFNRRRFNRSTGTLWSIHVIGISRNRIKSVHRQTSD